MSKLPRNRAKNRRQKIKSIRGLVQKVQYQKMEISARENIEMEGRTLSRLH